MWLRALFLIAIPTVAACNSREVSFFRDVKPIIQENCLSCHVPNGIAPFPLETLQDAEMYSQPMAAAILEHTMPPWPPGKDGLPLLYDRSLSDSDVQTIRDWLTHGLPHGNAADYVERPSRPQPTVRADLTLKMPAPYIPTPLLATGDDYRCFVFNPDLDRDRYVTGYAVRPGFSAVVHHVNLYLVSDPEAVEEVEHRKGDDSRPGYTCLSGPGGKADTNSQILGSWEPGAGAVPFPEHTAVRLPRDSRIVMLMHYSLLSADGPDQTSLDLQLGDRPDKEASVLEMRNQDFTIPAGMVDYTVERRQTVGPDFPAAAIYAAFPHMHFFGTSVSIKVHHPNGAPDTMLMDIPKWQYHWQGMYFLAKPLPVDPGDEVVLDCTYSNTAETWQQVTGKNTQPVDLHWGNSALDEMCLSYLYITGL
jgi:hypothetical protein